MSVVNKMLKDLQSSSQTCHLFEQDVAIDEPKKSPTTMLYLVALLIIITLSWYYWAESDKAIKHLVENDSKSIIKKTPSKPIDTISTTAPKPIATKLSTTTPASNKIALEKAPMTKVSPPSIKLEIKHEKLKVGGGAKLINTEKPIIIKRSKQDIAQKQLLNIVSNWSKVSSQNNKKALKNLLVNNPKDSELAIQIMDFSREKSASLHHSLLKIARTNLPENSHLALASARHSFSTKQYLTAINTLKKIDSYYWEASHYQLIGLSYQKLERHKEAIGIYKKLLNISPNNGKINMAIAISYEATNQLSQARANYLFAIEDKRLDSIQRQYIKQRLVAYQG